jgi:hypothetical protein
MLRNILIAIAAVSILAPLAFVPTGASAKSISRSSGHWRCRAEGFDGAYGISWNFATRSQAEERALRECNIRRPTCHIAWCDQNN